MEEQLETIVGIKNLKDQYRKAKLMCGDLRGLKNKFGLSEKFGVNPLQTFFNATSTHGGERYELTYTGNGKNEEGYISGYSMKDLVEEISAYPGIYEIELECLTWNKKRTDANRRTVLRFIYTSK